jgi:glycerol-3-phosphate acyltransferase PlsY
MTIFTQAAQIIGFGLLGYLSGSLPFAIWITRLFKHVDVRDEGSRHATTTNTFRQAGFFPALIVLVMDICKGFLPTWIALRYAPMDWIVPVTAALVITGHCWPLFANFRGGMGLATTGGCLLAVNPLSFIIGLGVLIVLTLSVKHSARAAVFTGLALAPVFWVSGLRGLITWVAVACGLIIAYRFLIDWNREYKELWLDREKS